jgi:hypothetical protein
MEELIDLVNVHSTVSSELTSVYSKEIEICSLLVGGLESYYGADVAQFISMIRRSIIKVRHVLDRFVTPALLGYLKYSHVTFLEFMQRVVIEGDLPDLARSATWIPFWQSKLGKLSNADWIEGSMPNVIYDSPRPYRERDARRFSDWVVSSLPKLIRNIAPDSIFGAADDSALSLIPMAGSGFMQCTDFIQPLNLPLVAMPLGDGDNGTVYMTQSPGRIRIVLEFTAAAGPPIEHNMVFALPFDMVPGHFVLSALRMWATQGPAVPVTYLGTGQYNVTNNNIAWVRAKEAMYVSTNYLPVIHVGFPNVAGVYDFEADIDYVYTPSSFTHIPMTTDALNYEWTAMKGTLSSRLGKLLPTTVEKMVADFSQIFDIVRLFDDYLLETGGDEFTLHNVMNRFHRKITGDNSDIPALYDPKLWLCGYISDSAQRLVDPITYYTEWFDQIFRRLKLCVFSPGFRDFYIRVGFK